jgi:hypothetical protein
MDLDPSVVRVPAGPGLSQFGGQPPGLTAHPVSFGKLAQIAGAARNLLGGGVVDGVARSSPARAPRSRLNRDAILVLTLIGAVGK